MSGLSLRSTLSFLIAFAIAWHTFSSESFCESLKCFMILALTDSCQSRSRLFVSTSDRSETERGLTLSRRLYGCRRGSIGGNMLEYYCSDGGLVSACRGGIRSRTEFSSKCSSLILFECALTIGVYSSSCVTSSLLTSSVSCHLCSFVPPVSPSGSRTCNSSGACASLLSFCLLRRMD